MGDTSNILAHDEWIIQSHTAKVVSSYAENHKPVIKMSLGVGRDSCKETPCDTPPVIIDKSAAVQSSPVSAPDNPYVAVAVLAASDRDHRAYH
jgi:hypothetical protein